MSALTVEEYQVLLKNKALSFYNKKALKQMLMGENPFPQTIQCRKIKSSDCRETRMAIIEACKRESEKGYTVEWRRIDRKQAGMGCNDEPDRFSFANEADLLRYLGKRKEVANVLKNAELLTSRYPEAKEQLSVFQQWLADPNLEWSDVLCLLDYFRDHPRPNLFARQLPLPISGKFFECRSNKELFSKLFSLLVPETWDANEIEFFTQCGLKAPEQMTGSCRPLDPSIWPDLPFKRFALPIYELRELDLTRVRFVFITENQRNFLSLPKMSGVLAVFGQGHAASALIERWPELGEKRLYYWGDIDARGFAILAEARQKHPNIESVFMDEATLDKNPNLVEPVSRHEVLKRVLKSLTPIEATAYRKVCEEGMRLEQEKIPFLEVEKMLLGLK